MSPNQNLPPNVPTQFARCAPSVQIQTCGAPNNVMTQCLRAEAALWARIAFDPVFPLLRIPSRYRVINVTPFAKMPQDAIRLNQLGSLPISTITAGRYNPILQYLVPPGYDGVINSTMNKFAIQGGPGLQDGSGMITWLLAINNYLQINYSNITMQMGDQSTLGQVAHDGGIRIQQNDLITFYAIVSTAGAAFLDPAGLINAGIQGWIYPNR